MPTVYRIDICSTFILVDVVSSYVYSVFEFYFKSVRIATERITTATRKIVANSDDFENVWEFSKEN